MTFSFRSHIEIGRHLVGLGEPTLIIAEAGVAHFGDMDMARRLVDLAANAGADVFKTQVFDVDMMISDKAPDWRDRLRDRNLSFDQVRELKDRCTERGLLFAATAHDESRIHWLRELDVPFIKVGSGERGNPAFIERLAGLGKPMIISTGMHTDEHVGMSLEACRAAGCADVALLHCVTSYPTPPEHTNLRAMDHLRQLFPGPVGYSDHTEDNLATLAAVARGATIVEKHITILKDIPNAQDWKVSADEDTLPKLVKDIRRVERLLGTSGKGVTEVEKTSTTWALKSLVAAADLPTGHTLSAIDLIAKRPGDGIPPHRINEIIGKTLARPLKADQQIQEADVDF